MNLPSFSHPTTNEEFMFCILMFVTVLGFQQVPLPDEIDGFPVDVQEETTTTCETSPHAIGSPMEYEQFLIHLLERPQNATDGRVGQYSETSTTSLLWPSGGPYGLVSCVAVVPLEPRPDPPPEPMTVPAPATVAILSITGSTLIYLLYGRLRRKR